MSTAPINIGSAFNGISQYASDFQTILSKATQTAQIPITLLQSQDSTILQKQTALGTLNADVAALAKSVAAIGTIAAGRALSATSSDASVVTVTNSGATTASSYSINSITSAASAASERTTVPYTDSASTPVSGGTMTLVIDGQSQTFSLAGNNLNGLSNQINSLALGVTASVVSQNGSNYLSLAAGAGTALQLFDGAGTLGPNLLSSTGTGTEQTSAGYSNPASTPVSLGTLTLVSGSSTNTFQLGSNTLVGIRDQINSLSAGVTATILTTTGGNYLSLSANGTGATTLQLFDGAGTLGTNLLTGTNQGADAIFQLNGIDIQQAGNVVNNVIPGVTFTIQDKSASPVTLSLASDPTQLSSALQDFVSNYNTVQQDIKGQVGSSGPLAGDSILNQLRQTLRQLISTSASSGSVQSLSDLGIVFDNTGAASFNPTTFSSLSGTQVSDAFQFLGSATSGFGGFSTTLSQFSDPVSGLIQTEVSGLQKTDKHIQDQITVLTARATALQASLGSQLARADALQAELQQQQQTLTASLQGLSLVLYGKNQSTLG